MNGHEEYEIVYEIGVVVNVTEGKQSRDCVEILEAEFRKVGLIVDRVSGVSDEFIKVVLDKEKQVATVDRELDTGLRLSLDLPAVITETMSSTKDNTMVMSNTLKESTSKSTRENSIAMPNTLGESTSNSKEIML